MYAASFVGQAMIESAEILARGDIATACIHYGRGPSFLEVQKVHLGRSQFRGLLWGVRERLRGMPEDTRKVIEELVPLGRVGEPEDIAYTALFLASQMGAYITGATIDVNGGILKR